MQNVKVIGAAVLGAAVGSGAAIVYLTGSVISLADSKRDDLEDYLHGDASLAYWKTQPVADSPAARRIA